MKCKMFLFSITLSSCISHASNARPSSLPYISGDTFRSIANFIIDDTNQPFNPRSVKNKDIIFVKTDSLNRFFTQFHPRIANKYILITHNSSFPVPGKFARKLEDKKIIAWFAQNPTIASHPKLIALPLGIANRYWPHGNIETLNMLIKQLPEIQKEHLLYLNITNETNPSVREGINKLFSSKPFCYKSYSKPWPEYLKDLARSTFVLSPRGSGEDCHRTWEALLMGCIPIVKSSSIDPLFQDLPVVIINDWNQVTEEFLIQKYTQMSSKTYNMDKIYAPWWIDKIKKHANS